MRIANPRPTAQAEPTRTNEAWTIEGIVYDSLDEARAAHTPGTIAYHTWRDGGGWSNEHAAI